MGKDTRRVLELVQTGNNVAIIGQAGTGKTFTLKQVIRHLHQTNRAFAVTASTGRAALNLNGTTIHSFSGAGNGEASESVYLSKMKSPWYRKAWSNIQVLIIEEISMVGKLYFELINKMAQTARRNTSLFGGLQLIVCGDFLQLPPINADYVFLSPIYQQLFPSKNTVLFQDIKRQTCPRLIKILGEARIGKLSSESIRLLKQCLDKPVPETFPIQPMILFSTKVNVMEYNMNKLDKIQEDPKVFHHTWQASSNESSQTNTKIYTDLLKNAAMYPTLTLKIGAQVMLTRNYLKKTPKKFNGSMGIVTGFDNQTNHPIVQFADGHTLTISLACWKGPNSKGTLIQYPLILAWALTIHKAQVRKGCMHSFETY